MKHTHLVIAAVAVTVLAGCGASTSGPADRGPAAAVTTMSVGDIKTVTDLAKFIGAKTQMDKTARFTVSVGAANPKFYDKPATGKGLTALTDSGADFSVSLDQPGLVQSKSTIIGPDVFFVQSDQNNGTKTGQETVQDVLNGSRGNTLVFLILNSIWVAHPETLDGAFTLVGSSSATTQDGQAVTRFRLTSDISKAQDLVDLQLGLPATNHSEATSVTVSVDYLVNADGQVVGFTSNFATSPSTSTENGLICNYKFSDWGKPVDIIKPS